MGGTGGAFAKSAATQELNARTENKQWRINFAENSLMEVILRETAPGYEALLWLIKA
jgi:hypothetical protein